MVFRFQAEGPRDDFSGWGDASCVTVAALQGCSKEVKHLEKFNSTCCHLGLCFFEDALRLV